MKVDPTLIEKLESELRNRYCTITQKGKKQVKKKKKKTKVLYTKKTKYKQNGGDTSIATSKRQYHRCRKD
jgi:hypothetical protein